MTDKPEGEATLFLALESICDAFESALQTDSSPRIEDYLAKVGSHQQILLTQPKLSLAKFSTVALLFQFLLTTLSL